MQIGSTNPNLQAFHARPAHSACTTTAPIPCGDLRLGASRALLCDLVRLRHQPAKLKPHHRRSVPPANHRRGALRPRRGKTARHRHPRHHGERRHMGRVVQAHAQFHPRQGASRHHEGRARIRLTPARTLAPLGHRQRRSLCDRPRAGGRPGQDPVARCRRRAASTIWTGRRGPARPRRMCRLTQGSCCNSS
jgi:hypothetical protein